MEGETGKTAQRQGKKKREGKTGKKKSELFKMIWDLRDSTDELNHPLA